MLEHSLIVQNLLPILPPEMKKRTDALVRCMWNLTMGFSCYVEIPHEGPFHGMATEVVCSGGRLGGREVTQL